MRIPRARITAPAVHACLFALEYGFWLLFERHTHSPGKLDLIAIVWFADLPISALAPTMTLGTISHAGVACVWWGVLGTIWLSGGISWGFQ